MIGQNLLRIISIGQFMWGETVTSSERTGIHNKESAAIESIEEDIDLYSKKVYKMQHDQKSKDKDACIKLGKDISKKLENLTQEYQQDSARIGKIKKLSKQFRQIEAQFLELKDSKIDKQSIFVNDDDDSLEFDQPESTDNYVKTQKLAPREEKHVLKLSKTQEATLNVEMAIASEQRGSILELEQEFIELKECFADLHQLVEEQQVSLTQIEDNVVEAHKHNEVAVQSVVTAGNRTIVKGTLNTISAVSSCSIQ